LLIESCLLRIIPNLGAGQTAGQLEISCLLRGFMSELAWPKVAPEWAMAYKSSERLFTRNEVVPSGISAHQAAAAVRV
jgi:hypothetical protein